MIYLVQRCILFLMDGVVIFVSSVEKHDTNFGKCDFTIQVDCIECLEHIVLACGLKAIDLEKVLGKYASADTVIALYVIKRLYISFPG